jgi:hypothetical protein
MINSCDRLTFPLSLVFGIIVDGILKAKTTGMYRALILFDKYCLSLPTARVGLRISGIK